MSGVCFYLVFRLFRIESKILNHFGLNFWKAFCGQSVEVLGVKEIVFFISCFGMKCCLVERQHLLDFLNVIV